MKGNNETNLAGCRVIVTGASRGFGRTLSAVLRVAGAELLLVSRSTADLIRCCQELTADGLDLPIHCIAADLAHSDGPAMVAGEAARLWPRIDVLVNNAATAGPIGLLGDNDWTDWLYTLQVNLIAAVDLCRRCLPLMNTGGRIINISGGGATTARPNFSAYATSKAGLVRFSETLARELEPRGIAVNCVAPGVMNTDLLRSAMHAGPERAGTNEYRTAQMQQHADDSQEEAAALCVFLASRRSDGITGRLISAHWDAWRDLPHHLEALRGSDVYTLRRIVPADRGFAWSA
jgi:NAD(P)-dependent dehydrogenase (short-subunit alcohol dehydrogenase family)